MILRYCSRKQDLISLRQVNRTTRLIVNQEPFTQRALFLLAEPSKPDKPTRGLGFIPILDKPGKADFVHISHDQKLLQFTMHTSLTTTGRHVYKVSRFQRDMFLTQPPICRVYLQCRHRQWGRLTLECTSGLVLGVSIDTIRLWDVPGDEHAAASLSSLIVSEGLQKRPSLHAQSLEHGCGSSEEANEGSCHFCRGDFTFLGFRDVELD